MSVIVEFQTESADFELGRILDVGGMSSVELERLVPISSRTVPLFWIHDSDRGSFIQGIQDHSAVITATEIDVFDDRALFTLEWDASKDSVIRGLETHGGQLLSALGTSEIWEFEVRFSDHNALSEFNKYCNDVGTPTTIIRIYNPTQPESEPWYNLTNPQRKALLLAVESGYYDIPRGCTTKELAAELGISDQAVTERLRRAISTLVTNTLVSVDGA